MQDTKKETALEPCFLSYQDANGKAYVYALCQQNMRQCLKEDIAQRRIPKYAVILAAGTGQPSEKLQFSMERYYGFSKLDLVVAA